MKIIPGETVFYSDVWHAVTHGGIKTAELLNPADATRVCAAISVLREFESALIASDRCEQM